MNADGIEANGETTSGTNEEMTSETGRATVSSTPRGEIPIIGSHVKLLAKSFSLVKADSRNRVAKKRLTRVAESFETNDVHVEMASDLTVNLTDRKGRIVRFEIKRTRSSKNET